MNEKFNLFDNELINTYRNHNFFEQIISRLLKILRKLLEFQNYHGRYTEIRIFPHIKVSAHIPLKLIATKIQKILIKQNNYLRSS